jgi:hypothetical protein
LSFDALETGFVALKTGFEADHGVGLAKVF